METAIKLEEHLTFERVLDIYYEEFKRMGYANSKADAKKLLLNALLYCGAFEEVMEQARYLVNGSD